MVGGSPWLVRAAILGALALTLTLAGPRAYTVLARRVRGAAVEASAPRAAVDRLGFRSTPGWLRGPLLLAVLADLEPRLQGRIVGLLDEAEAGALRAAVEASPWVARVRLERLFPDRFVAALQLRRPVLQVLDAGGDEPLALLDSDGVCLPPVAGTGLPRALLWRDDRAAPTEPGAAHPDRRARVAARVAVEWRDQLVPACPRAPRLLEVDTSNLDYAFLADGRWSEVLVGVESEPGRTVYLAYGHPPGSPLPRVPVADKAMVLDSILAEHPKLAGLRAGDLRFVNRWRDWLLPRQPPSVAGAR
ncbi:MAG: hypothetical protein AAF628_25750 [Planctomycetota bacterium]